ncbi:MAG: isocitrate/isopropylmalate family dehydrogenase [Planctomycetales bacterium]
MYNVTFIPGDGVGPEIMEATRKCVEATGVKINWDVQECGIEVIEAQGKVPDSVLKSIRANKIALKGPITTPIGKGFRSVNVFLRQELGLFACIRPCKLYKGVRSFFNNSKVDLVIVRENTEDLYAGVEFEAGKPETAKLQEFINSIATGRKITTGTTTTGISIKPISYEGTRKIANYAFDYALKNDRKSVCSVSKANIMKYTDGLWYAESRAVALAYGAKFESPELAKGVIDPDAELAGKVPNTNGKLRIHRTPRRQHVCSSSKPNCMTSLSSPTSTVTSSVTSVPVSSVAWGRPGFQHPGPEAAAFEATHGSAPATRDRTRSTPSRRYPLRQDDAQYGGEHEAAAKLERGVAAVIAEEQGRHLRHEGGPQRSDRRQRSEIAEAIIRKMRVIDISRRHFGGRCNTCPTLL